MKFLKRILTKKSFSLISVVLLVWANVLFAIGNTGIGFVLIFLFLFFAIFIDK